MKAKVNIKVCSHKILKSPNLSFTPLIEYQKLKSQVQAEYRKSYPQLQEPKYSDNF